jgi:hypothetical protein
MKYEDGSIVDVGDKIYACLDSNDEYMFRSSIAELELSGEEYHPTEVMELEVIRMFDAVNITKEIVDGTPKGKRHGRSVR